MNLKKYSYLILIPFLLLSCSKEDTSCENIFCEGNTTCVGGACVCQEGFEGEDCETLSRDKFIANWSGTDTCKIVLAGQNEAGQTELINYTLEASESSGTHNHIVFQYINEEGGYQIFGTTHQQRLTIPSQSQSIQLNDLPYPLDGTISGSGRLFNSNTSLAIKTSINGNVFIQGIGMVPASCECSGVMEKEAN